MRGLSPKHQVGACAPISSAACLPDKSIPPYLSSGAALTLRQINVSMTITIVDHLTTASSDGPVDVGWLDRHSLLRVGVGPTYRLGPDNGLDGPGCANAFFFFFLMVTRRGATSQIGYGNTRCASRSRNVLPYQLITRLRTSGWGPTRAESITMAPIGGNFGEEQRFSRGDTHWSLSFVTFAVVVLTLSSFLSLLHKILYLQVIGQIQ